MFYGQIMMQGYLTDPSVSFCAIGDATCDDAPLQITDFGQGVQLDQLISKIYLEGGGGGGTDESYELAAYFYLKHCNMLNVETPYFFVTGDEHFYTAILPKTIKEVFGSQDAKINSKDIWKELCKKFNVFHLHKSYFQKDEDVEILNQWKLALGEARILQVQTPKACIDVILGVMALTSGARTLEDYIEDMRDRGQTAERIEEVRFALKGLTEDFLRNNVVRFGGFEPVKGPKKPVNVVREEEIKKEDDVPPPKKEAPKKEDLKKIDDLKQELNNVQHSEEEKALKTRMHALKGLFKDKIPMEFLCPITQEILIDPVMAQDGNSYERKAIELWLEKHSTSPMTNAPLPSKNLLPNLNLKKLIADYVEANKEVLAAMNL